MSHIKSVRIENFRSIVDSGWVELEEDVTVLVGPNEAGKTNFLRAIERLNPSSSYTEDDQCFYDNITDEPKIHVKIADVAVGDLNITSRSPVDSLSEIGEEKLEVEVQKGYNDEYDVTIDGNENVVNIIEENRKDNIDALNRRLANISEMLLEVSKSSDNKGDISDMIDRSRRAIYSRDNTLTNIKRSYQRVSSALDSMSSFEDVDQSKLENIERELQRVEIGMEKISKTLNREIISRFPHPIFKGDIPKISDEADIDEIVHSPNNHPIYESLLKFCDIDPSIYYDMDPRHRHIKKTKSSQKLTDMFTDNWEQEEIEFEIAFGGDAISLHISDSSGSSNLVSHRSRGFQYFLSFFIDLVASSQETLDDEIILLDDPGVYLHPDAQHDLRQALENLSDEHQIIYTTHSSSMIDIDNIRQTRIVDRKNNKEGTYVNSDLSEHNDLGADVLSPIREALGLTFADSLFTSNRNLLVEGYIDRLLISRFSELFHSIDDEKPLDQKISIIDTGGTKTEYFARLLNAENYDFMVLLDSDPQGKQLFDKFEESTLKSERVEMLHDCVRLEQKHSHAIEDLFSNEFYIELVSKSHDINKKYLNEISENGNKIVDEVEAAFNKRNELEDGPDLKFKKSDVAELLDRRIAQGDIVPEDIPEETIQNFSNLIETVNETLAN